MENTIKYSKINPENIFLLTALGLLITCLVAGILASLTYVFPTFLIQEGGLMKLRPFHVSAAIFWIISGGIGSVFSALQINRQNIYQVRMAWLQWILFMISIAGIFHSYIMGNFGGREYWEFNPVWSLPIALSWLLFIINFWVSSIKIKKWPVYIWMWMTGAAFFLFTFAENYLWVLPYFRSHFITDMTIQWKANGSLVGSWNQLIYGSAFFIMEKISGDKSIGHSKMAFSMYFLGLFNLMFNWGHHVYTLPTENYIRYIGYGVSMTEWVFFTRIIYLWKSTLRDIKKNYHYFPYRFIMAADIWVFINMGHAILLSIPAINIYTHGTHITVAHAMGTTIGINSMILFATCFEFLKTPCFDFSSHKKYLKLTFWSMQSALLIFWITLNIAGIYKGIWQMSTNRIPFSRMMDSLHIWFYLFIFAGGVLLITMGIMAIYIIFNYIMCNHKDTKHVVNDVNNCMGLNIDSVGINT